MDCFIGFVTLVVVFSLKTFSTVYIVSVSLFLDYCFAYLSYSFGALLVLFIKLI